MICSPSSSPFSNANRINPGVSNKVLLRFFQTFSKSLQLSGLTCRTRSPREGSTTLRHEKRTSYQFLESLEFLKYLEVVHGHER